MKTKKLNKKKTSTKKSQPNSSSVHVNAPLGSRKYKKASNNPPLDNLGARLAEIAIADPSEKPEPLQQPKENTPDAEKSDKINKDDAGNDHVLSGMDAGNPMAGVYDMQQIISGIDYELSQEGTSDADEAKELAIANLSDDPDYYHKKFLEMDASADELAKDTTQTQTDDDSGVGLNLDLGSGQARAPGHIGLDLYPYDHGTLVHDVTLGLPFADSCAKNVRLVNSLEHMDGLSSDPKPLLSQIQRVLMPGGQFYYEGPNEIYNYPDGLEEIGKESVEKIEGQPGWTKQTFQRLAQPDAATANDSEPRIGVAQYDMLPADALLAMDATGYYWSDATSSGRGNRAHGYSSQGALVNKSADKVPIFKVNKMKQIVYGVVSAPDEADLQGDIQSAEDIEKTAHNYLVKSRVVGSSHTKPIHAQVVESYIAPMDYDTDGQYGPQTVKKGSWILGVRVVDPQEWQKVLDGEYKGFSVGGMGLREPVA